VFSVSQANALLSQEMRCQWLAEVVPQSWLPATRQQQERLEWVSVPMSQV